MRIQKLYAVYDREARIIRGNIMRDHNHITITRQLQEMVNDGKSEFAQHPEAYSLLELGHLDEESGLVEAHGAPLKVFDLNNLKRADIPDPPELTIN